MIGTYWRGLPRLIRFMIVNFADGVSLGWLFGLMLIWFDVASLGTLIEGAPTVWPTAIFFLSGGLLFGGLAMTVAVMTADAD